MSTDTIAVFQGAVNIPTPPSFIAIQSMIIKIEEFFVCLKLFYIFFANSILLLITLIV